MTPEDIIDILAAVAAIDRRTVGESDVIVWHAIIGDLNKQDAMTAVLSHFRECPGIWLEPGHIVAGVRAIRHDRYERERAEYEREERDTKMALIVAELAEAKSIPDDPRRYRNRRPGALSIACPWCHATSGTRCTTPGTRTPLTKRLYHPSREEAFAAPRRSAVAVADALCPVCDKNELITADDTTRGVCEPCARISAQPQPQPNGHTDTA
jgi:hypothetical protein